ncbi:MAG: hypothetical protein CVT49_09710 [candidate division Zixibacteria bacterium HGW-Zixibacteria-1]|nr:MAG: hypothetical protein CVT49_09710 [candidate division Zixibacteria bacterium HGW-Zixibacteria-1]
MIKIIRAGIDKAEFVIEYVNRLLEELGDEPQTSAEADIEKIVDAWRENENRFTVFIACDMNDQPAGVITLAECFAIYAGGNYGIINELYVSPEFRSREVGRRLLDTVKEYAVERGWKRIDVTAPSGERWIRTVKFYEREGFIFTGPKLKYYLKID